MMKIGKEKCRDDGEMDQRNNGEKSCCSGINNLDLILYMM